MDLEFEAAEAGAEEPALATLEDALAAIAALRARDVEHGRFFKAIGRRLDALEQGIHQLGEDVDRRVTAAVQAETQAFAQKIAELREELG